MSFYFVIIGTKDNPLYEAEFGTYKQGGDGIARFRDEQRHMNQFIAHSSLDLLEELQWAGTSGSMYLKCIERFSGTNTSFSGGGADIKFILLHDTRADEPIKQFFYEVYELYTKCLMSPFYAVDQEIRSVVFEGRVRGVGKKYL
ncbi:Sedlin [Peziza echinospora]|nr:Sedlin [Peziza echinospora]